MKITPFLALILSISIVISGCQLLPRKADLTTIHDAYRENFANALLVKPDKTNGLCGYGVDFDQTLEAIRAFEAKYRGETSAEMGHVTILKAMVHLQAGHFGIAEELKKSVESATISAADDREVRDTLLKAAYADLVSGWKAACASVQEVDKSLVSYDPKRKATLTDAADSILGIVATQAQESRNRPGIETDDGAIYLATAASIFQYYVFRMSADPCSRYGDKAACDVQAELARQGSKLNKGSLAVYNLLTDDEKKVAHARRKQCPFTRPTAAEAKNWKDVPLPAARQRYLDWYLQVTEQVACP